jgi:uncharacterized protein (DUF2249 family)
MFVNQSKRASEADLPVNDVTQWKATAVETLDVRLELEQGGEPFVRIMEAAERIPAGASLVIIAPFEPAPLYQALGARGFSHATQCMAADEWVVRFTHDR